MSGLSLLITLPGSPQTWASTISLVDFYPNKPAFLSLFLVNDTIHPLDSRAVMLSRGSDYSVTWLKCPQWNPVWLHSKLKCLPFVCTVEYDLPPACSFSLLSCLFSMLVFSFPWPFLRLTATLPVFSSNVSPPRPFSLLVLVYSNTQVSFFLWFISLVSCTRIYSWINT